MKKITLIFMLLSCASGMTFAQDEALYDEVQNVEMSIPSSPAFAMLGVNPEVVLRPSDLRSFKVDWRIKNYNLAPDLALEAQPLWHLYYKKRPLEEYARAGDFAKKLSTLSLSLGTAKIDGVNHAAYALKMNLYSENDPITDQALIEDLMAERDALLAELQVEIDSVLINRDLAETSEERRQLQEELQALYYQKQNITLEVRQKYRSVIEEYQYENWNRTMLDAAFGMVYTYNNTGLDSLTVKRAGMSFWLNGSLGIGKHGLLTGIFKYTKIIDSSNQLLGISYRHGNPKFNFFMEVAYERLGNFFDPTQDAVFAEEEFFADNYAEDLGSGWLNFNNEGSRNQYTVAYGGDFKLSRNILLNFALRTQFTNQLKMERLLPVANVICLMK
jgi:hypothetical protein